MQDGARAELCPVCPSGRGAVPSAGSKDTLPPPAPRSEGTGASVPAELCEQDESQILLARAAPEERPDLHR